MGRTHSIQSNGCKETRKSGQSVPLAKKNLFAIKNLIANRGIMHPWCRREAVDPCTSPGLNAMMPRTTASRPNLNNSHTKRRNNNNNNNVKTTTYTTTYTTTTYTTTYITTYTTTYITTYTYTTYTTNPSSSLKAVITSAPVLVLLPIPWFLLGVGSR